MAETGTFTAAATYCKPIKARVIFGKTNTKEQDVNSQMIDVGGKYRVPISRFGSWIFHAAKGETDIQQLLSTGGIVAAFIWGLFKTYPEVTVWVDDAKELSFSLDVGRSTKSRILNEIGNKTMAKKVEEVISSEEAHKDVKINLIRILPDNPSKPATPVQHTGKSNVKNPKVAIEETQSTSGTWSYIKLKQELKSEEQSMESGTRLKKLLEFEILALQSGKQQDADEAAIKAVKVMETMKNIPDDFKSIQEDIRKLHVIHFDASNYARSTELLFAVASLLKLVKNEEERSSDIQENLKKICEMATRIHSVKRECINVIVQPDDMLGQKQNHQKGGYKTAYEQARLAQQHGKRAFAKRDYEEALRAYDRAIGLKPDNMNYYIDKAEVYLDEKKLKLCKEECCKAIECGKKNQSGKKNLARAKALLGEAELRVFHCEAALNLFRESLDLNYNQDVADKVNEYAAEVRRVAALQEQEMMMASLNRLLPPQTTN